MIRYDIEFTLVTPCISAGADQQHAEMRVPEIRAQLRNWTRICGFSRDLEDRLFGALGKKNSDEGASAGKISVRCLDASSCKTISTYGLGSGKYDYFLWPFYSAGGVNHRSCLDAGGIVEIEVLDRSADADKDSFRLVLERFLLLGSLGSRSRRCYGSIYPVSVTADDGWSMTIPSTMKEFKDGLEKLQLKNVRILSLGGESSRYDGAVKRCADFLHNARCGSTNGDLQASQWGENDKEVVKNGSDNAKLTRPAIGLPMPIQFKHGNKYSIALADSEDKGDSRWASPVIFKVVKLGNAFVPLAMFLRDYCMPDGTKLVISENKKFRGISAISNRELFDVLASPNRHVEFGFSGAEILLDW